MYIKKQCGLSGRSGGTALSKLKNKGKVYQVSRGVWSLVSKEVI